MAAFGVEPLFAPVVIFPDFMSRILIEFSTYEIAATLLPSCVHMEPQILFRSCSMLLTTRPDLRSISLALFKFRNTNTEKIRPRETENWIHGSRRTRRDLKILLCPIRCE